MAKEKELLATDAFQQFFYDIYNLISKLIEEVQTFINNSYYLDQYL